MKQWMTGQIKKDTTLISPYVLARVIIFEEKVILAESNSPSVSNLAKLGD